MIGQDSEPVVLKRECKAVVVPAGIEIELAKDSLVYITQAMGGSFTIYFEGNLLRIAGADADARADFADTCAPVQRGGQTIGLHAALAIVVISLQKGGRFARVHSGVVEI